MKTSLSSAEFKSTLKHSNIQTFNSLQFYYKESKGPKIGFIINKKLGSSVERSRFKRQYRGLFLETCKKLNKDFSLVVWPKKPLSCFGSLVDLSSFLNK